MGCSMFLHFNSFNTIFYAYSKRSNKNQISLKSDDYESSKIPIKIYNRQGDRYN